MKTSSTKNKTNRLIISFTTLGFILLLVFLGIPKYKAYSYEKGVYKAVIATNSTDSLNSFLEQFPNGYFSNNVLELLSMKEFKHSSASGSYVALENIIHKYPKSNAAKLAAAKLDSLHQLFISNSVLKQLIVDFKIAVSDQEFDKAVYLADTIFDSTPAISSSFDFLQKEICDTLFSNISFIEKYDTTLSLKGHLQNINTLHKLYVVACKYQRYELAKACLLRSVIELSPYYCSEYTLRFYRIMQQSMSAFGDYFNFSDDIESCEKSNSLKSEIVEQIKLLNSQEFIFALADLFFGKNATDVVVEYTNHNKDLGRNEKVFIEKTFSVSLDKNVNKEITLAIYHHYAHPSVIAAVAADTLNYIDYSLTNLSNSMQHELQDPLLSIIDTGNVAQRINALVALSWIPLTDSIKQKLESLYPVQDPDEDYKIIEKMAIDFVYQKTGISDSISYLIKKAKTNNFVLAKRALSLLRYTRIKIPAEEAIEIINHVSSPSFYNPKFNDENNEKIKAAGVNEKFQLLAEVVKNAEYTEKLGEAIFKYAIQSYDGGEGPAIRQEWIATASHFKNEMYDIAQNKLLSDNILESKLALQLILFNDDKANELNLETRFNSEIIPLWSKNKYKFFKPFVKAEAKSDLAEQEKTTFYPYYIDYGKAYNRLTKMYYDDAVNQAQMYYYLKYGINTNKFKELQDFDNKKFITLLLMKDSSEQFTNAVQTKFNSTSSSKYKIPYAVILVNNGDINALQYLIKMLRNSNHSEDIAFYLSFLSYSEEQMQIVEKQYNLLNEEIASMGDLNKKKNEKESDFKQREKSIFISKFYPQFHLANIIAKHAAFKHNLIEEFAQNIR